MVARKVALATAGLASVALVGLRVVSPVGLGALFALDDDDAVTTTITRDDLLAYDEVCKWVKDTEGVDDCYSVKDARLNSLVPSKIEIAIRSSLLEGSIGSQAAKGYIAYNNDGLGGRLRGQVLQRPVLRRRRVLHRRRELVRVLRRALLRVPHRVLRLLRRGVDAVLHGPRHAQVALGDVRHLQDLRRRGDAPDQGRLRLRGALAPADGRRVLGRHPQRGHALHRQPVRRHGHGDLHVLIVSLGCFAFFLTTRRHPSTAACCPR